MNETPLFLINPIFEKYLPELNPTERKELKANIAKNGIREPVMLWTNPETGETFLIDGHNRASIAEELKIHYTYVYNNTLQNIDEVLVWMLENQLGRRNIPDKLRQVMIGQLYNQRQLVKRNLAKGEGGKYVPLEKEGRASEQIGKEYGVSEKTVRRFGEVAEVLDKADPNTRAAYLNSEISRADLIEKVEGKLPPVPRPVVTYEKDRNAETVYICETATEVYKLINATIKSFEKIKANPNRPNHLNPVILGQKFVRTMTALKELLHDYNELKFLYICIACEHQGAETGGGCASCIGGYVSYDTYQAQLKHEKEDPRFRGKNKKR